MRKKSLYLLFPPFSDKTRNSSFLHPYLSSNTVKTGYLKLVSRMALNMPERMLRNYFWIVVEQWNSSFKYDTRDHHINMNIPKTVLFTCFFILNVLEYKIIWKIIFNTWIFMLVSAKFDTWYSVLDLQAALEIILHIIRVHAKWIYESTGQTS